MLYHNEPILRDGVRVGFVTSGMYGHTLGAAVGLGYVSNEEGVTEEFIRSGRFELLVGNDRVPARASLRPLYDPTNERPRS
jgi:4-methylaminobutanoate oxidase (formaldehyde-forming)